MAVGIVALMNLMPNRNEVSASNPFALVVWNVVGKMGGHILFIALALALGGAWRALTARNVPLEDAVTTAAK